MQYLTFDEYQNLGGVLDISAFKRNLTRASGIIKNFTFGRIEKMKEIPSNAKELCRDLIEYFHANLSSNHLSSRSQTAGGVSESESYASFQEQSAKIQSLVNDYLENEKDDNGVPLLYYGCIE